MSTTSIEFKKENFQGKINKLVGMEKRESNPFIKIENGIDEFLFFSLFEWFLLLYRKSFCVESTKDYTMKSFKCVLDLSYQ